MIESDQCYTPKTLFDRLAIRFDLDVAAPIGGVPWIPAKRFLTEVDDGLATKWTGRVWMNPPFSNMKPWMAKFLDHGNGIALLPFSKSRWFFEAWQRDCKVSILNPEFKFVRNDKPFSIFLPTCLIACGKVCTRAIERVGKVR